MLMRSSVIPIAVFRAKVVVKLSMLPRIKPLFVGSIVLISKLVMQIVALMPKLVMLLLMLGLITVGVAVALCRRRGG